MLRITKAPEPLCLTRARAAELQTHRTVTSGSWTSALDGPCKQSMRESAAREQGGLCAYCMSRLRGTREANANRQDQGGMKLEHFRARNTHGAHTLDWHNILGVCPGESVETGGSQARRDRFHCDTFRGQLAPNEQFLNHNPAAFPPSVEMRYVYDVEGTIHAEDAGAKQDIERLNLNAPLLRRNRAEVREYVQQRLRRKLIARKLPV